MPISIRKLKGGALIANSVTVSQLSQSLNDSIAAGGGPKVTSITYPNGANANTTGFETITLRGAGFNSNINVIIGGANTIVAANITVTNTSHMTFVTPPQASAGSYSIYLLNTDGGATEVLPGLTVVVYTPPYQFQGTVSGYTSGGYNGTTALNTIDKFPFATNANATDVGDLTQARRQTSGQSSSESGYSSGGWQLPLAAASDIIDKFPFATNANATDVGDLSQLRYWTAGNSSDASGYASGGITPTAGGTFVNTIDKFPFASNANATDVGDLTVARRSMAGQSSTASGYISGGAPPNSNVIEKFPFASNANATDVGDLTVARGLVTGQSSDVSGYTSGGFDTALSNIIDKFPFASNANATDVGDLTVARRNPAGQSSTASGYSSGGYAPTPSNVIDKFPFASNANATDVGDITVARDATAGQQD